MLDSLYLYSCLLVLLIVFIRESVSTSGKNLILDPINVGPLINLFLEKFY